MTTDLLNLGSLYVSDFLAPGEEPRCPPAEMLLQMDDYGRVRLKDVVDPSFMYGRYWYRSGINESMKRDLKDVVDSILKIKPDVLSGLWLDIACNDGTLLSFVPDEVLKVGIDPVDDTFRNEALKQTEYIVQDFFSAEAYNSVMGYRADVITCIAMFYDLDDPVPFLNDVHDVLEDDGLFVLQMSYTPLMLEQNAFDNICHEHVYYYTLASISKLLEECGFSVLDCQLNETNGGSFRIYCVKDTADITKFGSQPYRDVASFRVQSVLDREYLNGYNGVEVWERFSNRIDNLLHEVCGAVLNIIAEGGTVGVYGASTKGNTLLQYFGLDSVFIKYAVERSPAKFGLRTVGTNIPIISEEEMRADPPTAMIILPWCFQSEFIKREAEYLKQGGKFIIPCPVFKTVTADDL